VSKELPFDPFPFIEDPHKQTILSSILNFLFEPASERKFIKFPDGDSVALEITTPRDWRPTDLTVFLVHGLCGSHKSPYMVRMTNRLEALGIRTVRYNMRGCGSGKGLAKMSYHSGRSEDVFECLKVLKAEQPESPMILVGFSLGGNVTLKLVGELGTLARQFLKKTFAVSPPVELYSSVQMLGDPLNAIYENYFYRLLRAEVHYRHNKFKDLPRVVLPRGLKLYEFDQLYTAPFNGFSSAIDYYNKCSASHVVGDIAIPCKILLSEDDPIIAAGSLDKFHLPSNVSVFKTKKGGHMGYLGRSEGKKGFYWLDNVLIDWITEP
jgi:predicted alpha/beta-fold hydrolase